MTMARRCARHIPAWSTVGSGRVKSMHASETARARSSELPIVTPISPIPAPPHLHPRRRGDRLPVPLQPIPTCRPRREPRVPASGPFAPLLRRWRLKSCLLPILCSVRSSSEALEKILDGVGTMTSPSDRVSCGCLSSIRRARPAVPSGVRSDSPAFSTVTLQMRSPGPGPRAGRTPFPRSLNSRPLWVSAGTFRLTRPSRVGTSMSPPSAAIANPIGTSQYRFAPSRTKMGCSSI